MNRLLLASLLVGGVASNALAQSGAALPPCSPQMTTAPQSAAPAPQTANAGRSYQSFSYEPGNGTVAAPVMAPVRYVARATRFTAPYERPGFKALGLYNR